MTGRSWRRLPKRNPITTLRAPWKVERGVNDTAVDESWDVVGEIYATNFQRSWVLIEVKPLPAPVAGTTKASEWNEDVVGGEIIVYFAETNRFFEHYREVVGLTLVESHLKEFVAPDGDDFIDFMHEHWSSRVSGEVNDWHPLDPEYPEDLPLGYRRVLEDFLDGRHHHPTGHAWHELPNDTVVIIHVPGDTPLITTLNAARLGTAEAEVYEAIYGQAMGRKEYEETNEDAVSDYPEAYVANGPHGPHRIMTGDMFAGGPNGHGWVTRTYIYAIGKEQKPYTARHRLLELVEACSISTTSPDRKLDDLQKFVREAVKYADIWCLSDPNDARRPDPEKDYVFMEYETEDAVEDQLDGALVERIDGLSEAGRARLHEALDRVDVHWANEEGNDLIYIGDVNAHWLFSIDVDTLIEEMYGEWQDLDPASFEDDEDT